MHTRLPAQAWELGMHHVFGGDRARPPRVTSRPIAPPIPTLLVENISPIVYTIAGGTRITIRRVGRCVKD